MNIVLDFDGVLFDTAYEAYVVSCLAYQEVCGTSIEIEYSQFLEYRYLVGPAWNYKYVIDFLSHRSLENPKKLINNAEKEDFFTFENAFFSTRERLKKDNFFDWVALNKPFDFFFYMKKNLSIFENVYIVSTKDKESILDILYFNGFCISQDRVFGANDFNEYKTKGNLILSKVDNANDGIIFIDDMKKHLDSLLSIDSICLKIQPSWGYIDTKDVKNVKSLAETVRLLESLIIQNGITYEI